MVFTLPHELNPLAQAKPGLVYGLLFKAASRTLLEFGRNPRWLGGEIGITMVLHAWGQNLGQHVHVHCIVTGGGLSPDGERWLTPPRNGFLFPVRALSKVFRGKCLDFLAAARRKGELHCSPADGDHGFERLAAALRSRDWAVYAKAPFADAGQVLRYLGRYTRKTAITNHRRVDFDGEQVRFRWRDHAHGNKVKVMRLDGGESARRFLLHVLPKGFTRIRHYGLLANRRRAGKLARCRELLAQPEPEPPEPARLLKMHIGSRRSGPLFVSRKKGAKGSRVHSRQRIGQMVRGIAREAGIGKRVRPRPLRHALATRPLAIGMDIASIQKFLGHADIGATRIHVETAIAMRQRKFGQVADPAGRGLAGIVRKRQGDVAATFLRRAGAGAADACRMPVGRPAAGMRSSTLGSCSRQHAMSQT